MVKVEPRPGSLSTVMSPPKDGQNSSGEMFPGFTGALGLPDVLGLGDVLGFTVVSGFTFASGFTASPT